MQSVEMGSGVWKIMVEEGSRVAAVVTFLRMTFVTGNLLNQISDKSHLSPVASLRAIFYAQSRN